MFNYRLIKSPNGGKAEVGCKSTYFPWKNKTFRDFLWKKYKKKYSTDLYLTFFAKNIHESFVVSGNFSTFANKEVERITNYELQITILQMAK